MIINTISIYAYYSVHMVCSLHLMSILYQIGASVSSYVLVNSRCENVRASQLQRSFSSSFSSHTGKFMSLERKIGMPKAPEGQG